MILVEAALVIFSEPLFPDVLFCVEVAAISLNHRNRSKRFLTGQDLVLVVISIGKSLFETILMRVRGV